MLLSDVELKRLEDLRNAVTTGTYGVSAAEAAERLIEYMMQPSLNLLLLEPAISPESGMNGSASFVGAGRGAGG